MIKILRLTICLIAVVLCILLSGCMEAIQLKERAIVQGIGIDKEDDEYSVTIQIFTPESAGGKSSFDAYKLNNKIVNTKGDTITGCLFKATTELGKTVFLGNNELIVIGQKAAEKGIEEILEFFNANHETRPKTTILIAEGKAEDIVSAQIKGGIVPANAIEMIVQTATKNGLVGNYYMLNLITDIQKGFSSPFAPIVKKESKEGQDMVSIIGSMCFDLDKSQKQLSSIQTRGILWIRDEINYALLTVREQKNITVRISESTTDINVELRNNIPHFKIKIGCSGGSNEKTENNDNVEKICSGAIQAEVRGVLDLMLKEEKLDVFKFGDYLNKYEYKYWLENKSKWKEIMPTCTYEIEVDVRIDRTNLVSYPENAVSK